MLVFDTETTGLISNRTIKLDKQPHIIQFYGCLVDLDTGAVSQELDFLIKPPQPLSDVPDFGSKKTTTQITGITNEMLGCAPTFKDVADQIFGLIHNAPVVVAHNLTFDMEMLDIEAERLNAKIEWPHGICSVEQTVHLTGQRLTLGALHEHLFGLKFADAHQAKADTQALVRCLVELRRRAII
jgi:DNA polymerase III epsilon subunit-like protein